MNMMQPGIKERYPLIDFAKYGTKSRLLMHPDLLIGSHPVGKQLFKDGDILDANGVYNLILMNNEALGVIGVNRRVDKVEEDIADANEHVQQNTESIEAINTRIDEVQTELGNTEENVTEVRGDLTELTERVGGIEENVTGVSNSLNDVYTKQQVDAALEEIRSSINPDRYKHVLLSQSQYDALSTYENNAIYFLFNDEDIPQGDGFPYNFPIQFGGPGFPAEFPVTLV